MVNILKQPYVKTWLAFAQEQKTSEKEVLPLQYCTANDQKRASLAGCMAFVYGND